jgi:hypothetical protein
MPDLLTPPRRNEPIGPPLAPAISVRYLGSAIWISREARLVAGAWLRNVGSEVARRIAIPDLAVAPDVWCRFRQIDDLEPGEEASLDPVFCLAADKGHLEYATLSGVISKAVVARVLAGGSPFARWPLRVEYEDGDAHRFVSACEIEVASLPLTLRATPTRVTSSRPSAAELTAPARAR